PCYCGLVISLAALVVIFFKELVHIILTLLVSDPTQIILGCLSLIDLSLTGNLLLTVIFSGYENFVSKFDIEHQDHINWKVSVDSSTLKLKLMSS
ncbi:YqhA family protein, partial [Salmonella enterica]|uniref:YqhA family protein n=1 Tax=Salmonella enterica TaxID=28901 RepID=UPI003299E310